MGRRIFDHLVVELSVAIGRVAPRYALWLHVQECGFDPLGWNTHQMVDYFDHHLEQYLVLNDLMLSERGLRRLRRRIDRFDPTIPTPYETMERIFTAVS